jgi:hypothetical protein
VGPVDILPFVHPLEMFIWRYYPVSQLPERHLRSTPRFKEKGHRSGKRDLGDIQVQSAWGKTLELTSSRSLTYTRVGAECRAESCRPLWDRRTTSTIRYGKWDRDPEITPPKKVGRIRRILQGIMRIVRRP